MYHLAHYHGIPYVSLSLAELKDPSLSLSESKGAGGPLEPSLLEPLPTAEF